MFTHMRNSALYFSLTLALLALPAGAATKSKAKARRQPPPINRVAEARAAYAKRDYQTAIMHYEALKAGDSGYLRTREELAWSYLMAGRLQSARGILVHLRTSLVPMEWRLESRVLSAMLNLRECQYTAVKAEIEAFRGEMSEFLRIIEQPRWAKRSPETVRRIQAEVDEAILKMKFVKMELRSRLTMLDQEQLTTVAEVAERGESVASRAQTFPVNGDVWVDEVFTARGEADSVCEKVHGKKEKL